MTVLQGSTDQLQCYQAIKMLLSLLCLPVIPYLYGLRQTVVLENVDLMLHTWQLVMVMYNLNRPFIWIGCRGRDRMVVGFTTTCAISAYHHKSCEFEYRSWLDVRMIQHYVIKFDSDLRQVGGFLRVCWFPPPIINCPPRYS